MTASLIESDLVVDEYRFETPVDGEQVPGVLWRPSGDAKAGATVLLGHGRTGHKRNPFLLGLARRLASRGWSVVAIDAPGHGQRRAPDAEPTWPRPDPDQAVREWHATIDLLQGSANLNTDRLGYWGMSMGTSLGISLIANDRRIRAAVLGLMHPNWPSPPGTRIRADAARLTCPVLFVVNWDDRRAPRSQAFELFELIGSTDKRLLAYPGDHGQLPDECMTASEGFLLRYLEDR